MSLQIRRLSHALGAEIIGFDIRKPLDDKTVTELHTVFLEYSVLLFRGQHFARGQHVALTRCFGEVDNNEEYLVGKDPEYPAINFLKASTKGPYGGHAGDFWHSDRQGTLSPSMATLLRGVEVPEVGGDTMFANMYLAYESLSDGMKKLIEGLDGVHPGSAGRRIDNSTPERAAETKRLCPPIAQPLVRVHPETGRKALYLEEKIKHIVGMTAEESEPLIQYLCKHATRPQFCYRHQWRKDDLLVWDNRCLMHNALSDYDDKTQNRDMERTAVRGTPSGYVYDAPL